MQWDSSFSVGAYLLIAFAVLMALLVARRTAISRSLRSLWFFIPRAIVLGLVLMVLLNPVRESARELPPRRARIHCLIDSSRSMGLDRPTTRLEQVKQVVYESQASLDDREGAQLQLYRFGGRFASIPSLPDLRAEDEKSILSTSLQDLAGLFQEPPKAIVVFSDGQIDRDDDLTQVIKDYQGLACPVHVYPVGLENIQGDIAIERLAVPRGAQAGDQVPIRVAIRSQGFDGRRVQLQVLSNNGLDQKPLAVLPITLVTGTRSYDIVVPADPHAGSLVLSIPVQDDEAIASNNEVPFEVLARERHIRVFYMEGTIHGTEYRYVRDALQDDPNIECETAIVDAQYVARPRLTRVDDPYRGFPANRQELFEYDVVICSDISRGAFTREQLEWTVELVNNRGGGFVMVGGHTSFGAGRWDQTVWDQLIPIDMRGDQIGQGFVQQQFTVNIPPSERDHPIWRIVEDPTENDRILDAMPPFYGTNIAKRVKPAATLLGESATRLTVAGRSPVFACQTYGRGRTFAMLTDTTEAWGSSFEKYWGENDNRHFRKFWRNVIHWLTENSVSSQRRLVVETDKLIYRPGEPILLSVQAYDEDYQPTTRYRLEAELSNAPEFAQSKSKLAVVSGKYAGEIEAVIPRADADEEASTLKQAALQIVAWDGGEEALRQEVIVQVLNDSDELLTPNPNHQTLEHLAKATGGRVLTSADDLVDALSDLKATPGKRVVHRSPVWDHPFLWLGMLGLVVSEWIMRRRAGGSP